MLEVKEVFLNKTKGYRFGDCEWYESFTDNLGLLFRQYQKLYGKCVSRVYVDQAMGDGTMNTYQVGWVFEKKMKYEDCNDFYIREVWVEYRKKV